MADIFVSYKKEDRSHAERISQRLKAFGFTVWWDDELTPREAWDATIEREISEATSVVVLWTHLSIASEWVRTEAHWARKSRKLVPLKLDSCRLPIAFSLTQTLDLSEWDGNEADRRWRKLIAWIADLKASAGASTPVPTPTESGIAHDVIGRLPTGEPIVDGVLVDSNTPSGTLFKDHLDGPTMIVLPAGDFVLGGAEDDPDRSSVEVPQRRIEIMRQIAFGLFPVTVGQFANFGPPRATPAGANEKTQPRGWFGRQKPIAAPTLETLADPEIAASGASFEDAMAFGARLSGVTACTYRLPSETEWEYACRAGSRTRFNWGDAIDPSRALYRWEGAAHQRPIAPGRFAANSFGLHDMHGNVREWVMDTWQESYESVPLNGLPVVGGHSSMRVTRGGGWSDPPSMLRSSARGRATQTIRAPAIGFRVVRTLL